jgi:hypothetical protein
MVQTYFELGRRIVEKEQEGKEEAGYGEYLIQSLSEALTAEFGRGYSKRNLELMLWFLQNQEEKEVYQLLLVVSKHRLLRLN